MATYQDILRMLAIYDRTLMESCKPQRASPDLFELDERSSSIARIAAMIAHDGSVQMFRWAVGDALDIGVTPDEIVGVMLAIAPLVGDARIANSAPKLALALDYDLDEALEMPGP